MKRILLVLVIALAPVMPAQADTLLESYVAELGPDDHYNSRGKRLSQAWQVLRQDRANYHRFGIRDRLDEGDSFFASKQNRAIAERMLRRGRIDRGLARRIVNRNIVVIVEIWGRGTTGTSLRVYEY